MIISGLEKLTLLDYPDKIACIIFTQGCNLRCPFCQNSSLVVGNPENIDETVVFDYLNKRKNILDGVVITGGEPLIQKDIKEFIIKIKELGLKVKLDTNGSNPVKLKELIDSNLIDYIAMDIKQSPNKYEKITGIKNINYENIKKSIEIIKSSNVEHEFRTTLVKEFHNIKDIQDICKCINDNSKYYLQNYKDSESVLTKGLHGFSSDEILNIKESVKFPNLYVRGI